MNAHHINMGGKLIFQEFECVNSTFYVIQKRGPKLDDELTEETSAIQEDTTSVMIDDVK